MGLVVGALIAAGAVLAFRGTRRAMRAVPPVAPRLREQLAVVAANRPFRRLLVIVTVQSAATGAMLAGAAYVARLVLRDPAATSALVIAFTTPAILLLPVLVGVGGRIDKRRGVLVSSVAFVLAGLAWLAVPEAAPLPVVLAIGVALGAANAVQDTFVLAILPDCIAADTARTGRRLRGRVRRRVQRRPGPGLRRRPAALRPGPGAGRLPVLRHRHPRPPVRRARSPRSSSASPSSPPR